MNHIIKHLVVASSVTSLLVIGFDKGAMAASLAGPYVGVQMGWAQPAITVDDPACMTNCSSHTSSALGASNGIQLGWSWISGSLLTGVQADFAHTGIKTRFNFGYSSGFSSAHYGEVNTDFRNSVSLRWRLGLVLDNTALIVSAGPLLGDVESELRYTVGDSDPSNDYYSRNDKWVSGLVTAIGIEHALTDHVNIGLELSRSSFKNESVNMFYGDGSLYDGYQTNHSYSSQAAAIVLNWQF